MKPSSFELLVRCLIVDGCGGKLTPDEIERLARQVIELMKKKEVK